MASFRDLLADMKQRLLTALSLLENAFAQGLESQQKEFRAAYRTQLAEVESVFSELRSRVNRKLAKEEQEQKLQKAQSEKAFFVRHALFLSEQNDKLSARLRKTLQKLREVESERDYYRQQLSGPTASLCLPGVPCQSPKVKLQGGSPLVFRTVKLGNKSHSIQCDQSRTKKSFVLRPEEWRKLRKQETEEEEGPIELKIRRAALKYEQ